MIVVADTSPLVNLAVIGKLDLLRQLYMQVLIPDAVAAEIRVGEARGAHFAFLDSATWLEVRAVPDRRVAEELRAELDLGEAEAIALSLAIGADLLLVDEQAGRRAAGLRGLRTVGLLGTLVAAKSRGLLSAIRPSLDDLRTIAGFWMSDELFGRVLQAAGEGP